MSEPITQTYGVTLRVEFDEYHEVVASSFEEAAEKAKRRAEDALPGDLPGGLKIRPLSACNDAGEQVAFLNSPPVSGD